MGKKRKNRSRGGSGGGRGGSYGGGQRGRSRPSKNLPSGNRFLIYTLYPECNVEVRIFDGKAGEFTVCAVGHSIFNRTCTTDVGQLLKEFGGGGHTGAGTCQVPLEAAEEKISELVSLLKEDEADEEFSI